mgnify:FL=1
MIIARIIRLTKKFSLIIPESKATVARTIAGPPRAFIAIAKLKLDNQVYFRYFAVNKTVVPCVNITKKMCKTY